MDGEIVEAVKLANRTGGVKEVNLKLSALKVAGSSIVTICAPKYPKAPSGVESNANYQLETCEILNTKDFRTSAKEADRDRADSSPLLKSPTDKQSSEDVAKRVSVPRNKEKRNLASENRPQRGFLVDVSDSVRQKKRFRRRRLSAVIKPINGVLVPQKSNDSLTHCLRKSLSLNRLDKETELYRNLNFPSVYAEQLKNTDGKANIPDQGGNLTQAQECKEVKFKKKEKEHKFSTEVPTFDAAISNVSSNNDAVPSAVPSENEHEAIQLEKAAGAENTREIIFPESRDAVAPHEDSPNNLQQRKPPKEIQAEDLPPAYRDTRGVSCTQHANNLFNLLVATHAGQTTPSESLSEAVDNFLEAAEVANLSGAIHAEYLLETAREGKIPEVTKETETLQAENLSVSVIQGENLSEAAVRGENLSVSLQAEKFPEAAVQAENLSEAPGSENLSRAAVHAENLSEALQAENFSKAVVHAEKLFEAVQAENLSREEASAKNLPDVPQSEDFVRNERTKISPAVQAENVSGGMRAEKAAVYAEKLLGVPQGGKVRAHAENIFETVVAQELVEAVVHAENFPEGIQAKMLLHAAVCSANTPEAKSISGQAEQLSPAVRPVNLVEAVDRDAVKAENLITQVHTDGVFEKIVPPQADRIDGAAVKQSEVRNENDLSIVSIRARSVLSTARLENLSTKSYVKDLSVAQPVENSPETVHVGNLPEVAHADKPLGNETKAHQSPQASSSFVERAFNSKSAVSNYRVKHLRSIFEKDSPPTPSVKSIRGDLDGPTRRPDFPAVCSNCNQSPEASAQKVTSWLRHSAVGTCRPFSQTPTVSVHSDAQSSCDSSIQLSTAADIPTLGNVLPLSATTVLPSRELTRTYPGIRHMVSFAAVTLLTAACLRYLPHYITKN